VTETRRTGGATLPFRFFPRVLASRALGLLERAPIPRGLRAPVYRAYARRYDVDLSEAEAPLESFRSLNEFFVRRLRPGLRPIDPDPDSVVSPVDGRIATFGPIERGRLLQAKGLDYSLEELVAAPLLAASLVGGSQITFYLAPGEYHRIHAPIAGEVSASIHVPGTLWPVNEAASAAIRDLFIRNERVVTVLESRHGTVILVKVGAFNVGSIRVEYDPAVGRGRRARYRAYPLPRHFEKGEEIARFEMGSTVIVCLPAAFKLEPSLRAGARIRLGERIALFEPSPYARSERPSSSMA
jgi:phosphatidylserine decarboxylase